MSNIHLEKMVNKAEEWIGKVMWMSSEWTGGG